MKIVTKHFNELSLTELYEILKARINVFVVEQNCPYPEIDDKDQDAYHIFIKEDQEIVAYLRVLAPGVSYKEASVGRVLTTKRNKGYGNLIMNEGIKLINEKYGLVAIRIGAQLYAKGFYEHFGFYQVSDEYLEDGIAHIEMVKDTFKR